MDNDQAEAMKMLGIRKACVVGVSRGGMIAQYPDATEKSCS